MALIGYWRLNGNSNDASGNGKNGTDTDITYKDGIGKYALFNGSSSKVSFSRIILDHTTNILSVAVLFCFNSLKANNVIFGQTTMYRLLIFSDGGGHFVVKTDNNDWYGAGTYSVFNNGAIQINKWYYIVCVYNGTNVLLYLNGQNVNISSPAISGNLLGLGNAEIIGYDSTVGYCDIKVDELMLRTDVISPVDIKNKYSYYKGFF